MNKKDLINSFESLTPSDCQKERMLNNVLNSGMEKNVHKVTFNFRYAFSTVAAAACVIAVIVAVGPMYEHHKLSQNHSQEVTKTNLTNDVIEATDETDIALSKKAVESKQTDEINSTPVNAEFTAEPAPAVEESFDELTLPAPDGRMLVMEDAIKAYTPQLNFNSFVGGGAGGTASYEYIESTAVNYKSDFDLPEGFSKVTDESGNPHTFRYVNGSSYININATGNTEYVLSMLNSGYLTTDINGTTAVVFENGKEYTAYIISDDVAYTIDTYDVSEEDLANLLLSIAG